LYLIVGDANKVNTIIAGMEIDSCLRISNWVIKNVLIKDKYYIEEDFLKIKTFPLNIIIFKSVK
jgi:hypothetical protein